MKRKKRVKTKKQPKRVAKTPTIIKACLIFLVLFVLIASIFKITELILINKNNNFPKLSIFLKDAPIEQIDAGSKDDKYQNNSVTFSIDNISTDYNDVEIKGRGNTTWEKIKKPYQIKFKDKENFFNIGESKKWVLLANYLDPTFLRNDTAFYLEKLFVLV